MTGYAGPIESHTLKNTYFRQVLFTGKHAQLVVMCLQPGEEIGKEVHHGAQDQERGRGGRSGGASSLNATGSKGQHDDKTDPGSDRARIRGGGRFGGV
jgi:hypothetical protein